MTQDFIINGTFKCSNESPGILQSYTHSIVQVLNHFVIFADRLFVKIKSAQIIIKILQKENTYHKLIFLKQI